MTVVPPFRRFAPLAMAALACAGALARVPAQQVTASLDAGSTTVQFPGVPLAELLGVTPLVSGAGAWWSFSAGGTLASRDESGGGGTGATSRGAVAGTVRALSSGPLALELGARSGWDDFAPGTTSRWWRGEARAALDRRVVGAWLGASGGQARGDDGWHTVASASTGGWVRLAGATLSATITNARAMGAGTYRLFTVNGPGATSGHDSSVVDTTLARGTASVTDGEAALEWQRGALGVAMSVGTRFSGSATDRLWGSAQATLWLNSRLALVASGGSLPSSLTEFRPASRYATFGLRFAHRAEPTEPATGTGTQGSAASAAARAGVTVGAVQDGGLRSLRVRVPGAHSVEVMGDFTNWSPLALTSDGSGEWSMMVAITPGAHRMNVRVDGGGWQVPPGLAPVRDDFNGNAGLLIVQ